LQHIHGQGLTDAGDVLRVYRQCSRSGHSTYLYQAQREWFPSNRTWSFTGLTSSCTSLQALDQRGAAPEDLRVLRALWNIFSVFATPPEAPAARGEACDGAGDGRDAGAQPCGKGRCD
jgi:hypothetical protein